MEASSSETPSQQTDGPVVARPGRYYRNARYIMVAILFGYGLFSIYDGFVRYPRLNREEMERQRQANPDIPVNLDALPHGGLDVPFNRAIGLILPPLALIYLGYMFYVSRGEYRLEGKTLHVPGHPPVPFENITEIDKRLWDRKGIVVISYDLGNGEQGKLKLDDFVYERDPTDEIYKRIEAFVSPSSTTEAQEKAPG
jgi:hypothetical protein